MVESRRGDAVTILYKFSLRAMQPSRPKDASECSMLKKAGESKSVEVVV